MLAPAEHVPIIPVIVAGEVGMREIQMREAKANLSAVIDDAVRGEPSLITRHGRPAVVILSVTEWERLSAVPSFAALVMSAPEGIDDIPKRGRSGIRNSGL